MKSPKKEFTQADKDELKRLENIIEPHRHEIAKLLSALDEIKRRRLWITEADSFEEFCTKNWGAKFTSTVQELLS